MSGRTMASVNWHPHNKLRFLSGDDSVMTAPEHTADDIAQQLLASMREHRALDAGLDSVLSATKARATGLWRVEGDRLRLLGFRAVADMAAEVKSEFAAATRAVTLAETGLGIVKAVVSNEPAFAEVDDPTGKLGGSASWLVRFGARRSLAVPIRRAGRPVGVLAISTAEPLRPEEAAWQLLVALASRLSDEFPSPTSDERFDGHD